MNRRYVIMSTSLSNMGGAQMYMRNKLLYLRNSGWSVLILAGKAQNIVIPELREFNEVIPELQFSRHYYRKSRQDIVTQKVVQLVNDKLYDDIVIESTGISQSAWAEAVARQVGARHFIYILQEHNRLRNVGLQKFFLFKHSRHEIAGIANKTLAAMFQPFHPLEENQSYQLSSYCSNAEADVDCPFLHQIDRSRYDYLIGAFSRLDKPFVSSAIEDICRYASTHADKRFLFLWIGDAPKGNVMPKILEKTVKTVPNMELLVTGYLFPVPTRLLELCDVLISSSGSSWSCMRSGVPTITYDGNDYQPIGILGRTTHHALFRGADEPPQQLDMLLDQILVKKQYPVLPPKYKSILPDYKIHMDFIDAMPGDKHYYDVDSLRLETISDKIIAFNLFFGGPDKYASLLQAMKK